MRVLDSCVPALAVVALLAGAGCKRTGEAAADAAIAAATGGKADVSQNGDTTTITSKDGKQTLTINAGALPANFPKDLYLPAGYKVESALDAGSTMIAHVLTPGTLAAVAADADKNMLAQGWKQTMTLAQSEQAHIVLWEKGERHATLTITGDTAQGGVQVGYQLATTKQ